MHTHGDIELNWTACTRLTYAMGGGRVSIEPGEIGLFWGGIPHQLCHVQVLRPPATPGVWITLPLTWFLARGFSHALDKRLMSGELIAWPLEGSRVEQWAEDFGGGQARRRLVLLELEAAIERQALRLPEQGPRRAGVSSPDRLSHVDRLAAVLAQRYRQPLSIPKLTAELGLHPNYAMTLFRRAFGLTIKQYLTQLRLAHAQRLLATTRRSVLDVALDSGFGSLGRFYAAFAAALKQRPLEYRRRHRQP
jgi:AraC-like DNA-binding protein